MAQPGSTSWFVYYQIQQSDLIGAVAAVSCFQAALQRQWPALEACLMKRAQTDADLLTLMEVYVLAPPAAQSPQLRMRLAAEIEHAALALAGLCRGARHVEVFEPCA